MTGRAALAVLAFATLAASPTFAYTPIAPRLAGQTVVLTGHDLTIGQLVAIARGGAKVELSPGAQAQAADTYGLLLEAAAEGVPVYAFTRSAGTNRETTVFTGDPYSPEIKARLEQTQLRAFQNGARAGAGPEIADEASVRAMMAVRANTIVWDGPSPQLVQRLLDLLNARITPVVQSPSGSVGQDDIALMQNVAAVMVGKGEAYLNGVRMPAAEALRKAGLKPIQPFGADNVALANTNAFTASQAALLTADAETMLEWADLIYGLDLLGMNSSVAPLAAPTQLNRPEPWLNWHAARMLGMLRGSYLFEADPKRIIADADSLRASSIRQGSAWRAWAELRDAALLQINSSDHNPTIRVGLKPTDSWELSSPQLMRFFVKGGPDSNGQSGYILATANWDPYPLANQVEAFTLALGEMDVAVLQRFYKFAMPFHTGVSANDVLTAEQRAGAAPQGNGTTIVAFWGQVEQALAPIPPLGVASDNEANGDIESQLPLKVAKARRAVDASLRLLSQDLMTAAYWIDVRRAQDRGRRFAAAPAAVWAAYRKVSPWGVAAADRPDAPAADAAYDFLLATPPETFLPAPADFPK